MKDFSLKIEKSRGEFRARLDQEITQIFERLFLEIQHDLKEPLSRLEAETARIVSLAEEARHVGEAAEAL